MVQGNIWKPAEVRYDVASEPKGQLRSVAEYEVRSVF